MTVPAGFAFQAQLEGFEKPSIFESTAGDRGLASLRHLPSLPPPQGPPADRKGLTALDIVRLGGADRSRHPRRRGARARRPDHAGALRRRPRRSRRRSWWCSRSRPCSTACGSASKARSPAPGPPPYAPGSSAARFRHHGAEAARSYTTYTASPPSVTQFTASYSRSVAFDLTSSNGHYSELVATEMPLDSEVDDLAAGANAHRHRAR